MNATLAIAAWRNEYQLPRAHPAQHTLRAALDAMFARVADELARGLPPCLDDLGDAVVVVRRLEFDCAIDTSCDKDRGARHWALRFTHALLAAIDRPDGNVVRFPTQAAYRARFIADLAAGRAWQTWFYRGFDGLRLLPPAAAIRTVLLESPEVGRATLLQLDASAWASLSAMLDRHEARRIASGLTEAGGSADGLTQASASAEPDIVVLSALADALALASRTLPAGCAAASVTLYLCREVIARGLPWHAGTLLWASVLAWLDRAIARDNVAAAIAALRHGGLAVLARAQARPDPQIAAALAGASSALRHALADAWQTATRAAPASADAHAIDMAPYGGLAPLLAELAELLDENVCAALPGDAPAEPRDLAALLALALATGSESALSVWRDPFWRDFLSVPPRCDGAALQHWLSAHDPMAARAALDTRIATFARGAALTVPHGAAGARTTLPVDTATGLWLCDQPAPRAASHETAAPPWRTRLRLARLAREDARALARAADALALPAAWRPFFTRLAQAALRRFAYRIAGLACSSPRYLLANLLAVRGQASHDDALTVVLQLARPPLHVLLRMSGGTRREIAWRGNAARNGRLRIEYAP